MQIQPRPHAAPFATLGMVASALLLGGCNGAFVGNIVVLFVSVGIFFGTLNLGRLARPASGSTTADQSQPDR